MIIQDETRWWRQEVREGKERSWGKRLRCQTKRNDKRGRDVSSLRYCFLFFNWNFVIQINQKISLNLQQCHCKLHQQPKMHTCRFKHRQLPSKNNKGANSSHQPAAVFTHVHSVTCVHLFASVCSACTLQHNHNPSRSCMAGHLHSVQCPRLFHGNGKAVHSRVPFYNTVITLQA